MHSLSPCTGDSDARRGRCVPSLCVWVCHCTQNEASIPVLLFVWGRSEDVAVYGQSEEKATPGTLVWCDAAAAAAAAAAADGHYGQCVSLHDAGRGLEDPWGCVHPRPAWSDWTARDRDRERQTETGAGRGRGCWLKRLSGGGFAMKLGESVMEWSRVEPWKMDPPTTRERERERERERRVHTTHITDNQLSLVSERAFVFLPPVCVCFWGGGENGQAACGHL